jgi:hypothetical protein
VTFLVIVHLTERAKLEISLIDRMTVAALSTGTPPAMLAIAAIFSGVLLTRKDHSTRTLRVQI